MNFVEIFILKGKGLTYMLRSVKLLENALRINKVFSPARIMIIGFILIILIGALLLMLPISTKSGESVSFLTALFTSTSATCVTGLVVTDTATTWSPFGAFVILCLIQVGGLGFMSIMTIIFFISRESIGLSQRLLIVQSLSLKDMKGVVRLVRHLLIGTFLFEGIGAFILWIRFSFDYGVWKGLYMGIWHSISAFCNAGFDLLGTKSPFSSLTSYHNDLTILSTVMLLIVIGGIGFYVWEDIWLKRSFRKLHLHSKLTISISLFLIVAGSLFYFFAEYNNVSTMHGMSFYDRVISSLFQSVSPRTAGFNTINQAGLTDSSKIFTMILMFIGGSPGSTSGGIKTVNAAIIILSAISSLRGKVSVSVFGRNIPTRQILSALSVMILGLVLCITSSMIISMTQNLPYFDVLFETFSAIGTVGLSTGITPSLAPLSQIIIICLMFFGRVGIMTIGMAAIINRNNVEKIKYPDTWIMNG